jgi:cytochrome c556
MTMRRRLPLFFSPMLVLSLGGLAAVGCVPKKDLPPDEIQKLQKLDDVMAVQATLADPHWKQIGKASFTDAELASLTDAGDRLQVTSLKIKDFSKGGNMDALAAQLHDRAADLSNAARAKDANAVSKALADMKATCKECHSKFR